MKPRSEYTESLARWQKNRAVRKGSDAVKELGDTLLPRPAAHDESDQNRSRFDQYLERAVFYPIASRTITGMAGLAMANPPTIDLPPELDGITECADGAGTSCAALTDEVITELLTVGRMGILSDHSSAIQTEADTGLGPVLVPYRAEQIVSWFERTVDGRPVLEMILLEETTSDLVDNEVSSTLQRRLLAIEDGVYVVRLFQKIDREWIQIGDDVVPTDGNGNRLDFIPWSWGGSERNDSRIDKATITDIADLNIAHYIDSADYQESVYLLGQPMVAFAGLTQNWIDDFLKDIYVGARQAILLPSGGTASIIQAQPNTLASEAMAKKETLMTMLGAMLITGSAGAKTAEQIKRENAATQSALETVIRNASDLIRSAIDKANIFTRSQADFTFEMKPDLRVKTLDAQTVLAIVQAWQQGALPTADRNELFRSIGLVDPEKTDDEIAEELSASNVF